MITQSPTLEELKTLPASLEELQAFIVRLTEHYNNSIINLNKQLNEKQDKPYTYRGSVDLQSRHAERRCVMKWIDPNDKTQEQYLPHIGEKVLFCYGGETYYGKHTGGSFQTGSGAAARNFNTWECHWMYPPAAMREGTGK